MGVIKNFKYEINDVFYGKNNKSFIVLEKYIKNNNRHYKVKCCTCGEVSERLSCRCEINSEKYLGCGGCAKNYNSNTEEFVKKAVKVHGDKYDYSLVKYINCKTAVDIICREHGIFKQTPNNHLLGKNCPKCVGGITYKTEDFIKVAKNKFGDLYDYSLVDYKNNITNIKIICKKHGIVEVEPKKFLKSRGCNLCFPKPSSNTEKFIEKSKLIHGERYDYSLVDYKNRNALVKIICPVHGEFEQSPSGHLSGKGCKICNSVGGYNLTLTERNKKIWLNDLTNVYVFKLKNKDEEFFKIGIAKNIKNRMRDMKPYNCELLYSFCVDRYNASYIEKKLHGHFYEYSYCPNIKFEGYTECFSKLSLDEVKTIINSYDIKVGDSHES